MDNRESKLKIVADENIPFVRQAFTTLGQVATLPGREIQAEHLVDADMLLVRSVTRVNHELLHKSPVRFVATATIGLDHLDVEYLQQRGIGFASAPGCNANSVAEYVLSALMVLTERQGFTLQDKTVGIIGCGNVGSRLQKKLHALGVRCLVNDPPLQEQTGDPQFLGLEQVLEADIVSIHVPLQTSGRYPTYHLVDESFLSRMKKNALLINTSRGAVVDETALKRTLAKTSTTAVLDVWEGEPNIDAALLERVELATPHIAGYSLDGKVNGTRMIYEAACRFFGVLSTWNAQQSLPESPVSQLTLPAGTDENQLLTKSVLAAYDIRKDDFALRQMFKIPPAERGRYFDSLRKDYPVRREFHNTTIQLAAVETSLANKLAGIGFEVDLWEKS
ncbi:MAG: 4-phosphoerythronate dehydrogenase PdxB [bacterium]